MAIILIANLNLLGMKEYYKLEIDRKFVFRAFSFIFFSCFILSTLGFLSKPTLQELTSDFVVMQSVGICTACVCIISLYILSPKHLHTIKLVFIISMIPGIFLGTFIARTLYYTLGSLLDWKGSFDPNSLIVAFFLGPIVAYIFFVWENNLRSEERILEEKMKRLVTEKQTAETNLRLLHAQIEPHFLFNTLSNTRSLLDTNIEKSKIMLDDLTQYLRATLSGIRRETTTIDKEMVIVRAYIDIFKIRLGDRLEYTIDIPYELKNHVVPSMLIQPLVENAIKHGIEPKVEGGKIIIKASKKDDILRIEIHDNGLGLSDDSDIGVGLTNIRERLHSLFDIKGKLILEENTPMGVKAIIEVPYVG